MGRVWRWIERLSTLHWLLVGGPIALAAALATMIGIAGNLITLLDLRPPWSYLVLASVVLGAIGVVMWAMPMTARLLLRWRKSRASSSPDRLLPTPVMRIRDVEGLATGNEAIGVPPDMFAMEISNVGPEGAVAGNVVSMAGSPPLPPARSPRAGLREEVLQIQSALLELHDTWMSSLVPSGSITEFERHRNKWHTRFVPLWIEAQRVDADLGAAGIAGRSWLYGSARPMMAAELAHDLAVRAAYLPDDRILVSPAAPRSPGPSKHD